MKARQTSLFAYESVKPVLGRLQQRVLNALIESEDGLTDEQIRKVTQIQHGSACARRGELLQAGLIKDSGRLRPNQSGRMAVVWEVIDEG